MVSLITSKSQSLLLIYSLSPSLFLCLSMYIVSQNFKFYPLNKDSKREVETSFLLLSRSMQLGNSLRHICIDHWRLCICEAGEFNNV